MRAVAERADVAVKTLYRYFPSKVHLLVSALAHEFEKIDSKGKIPPGTSPLERMQLILSLITRAMQRDPLLTGDDSRVHVRRLPPAAAEVDQVGQLMDRLFTSDDRRGANRRAVGDRARDLRCVAVNLVACATLFGYRCRQSTGIDG